MVRQREFEDRVAKAFSEGKVPGFVHLSQGQEATAAGSMAALRSDDYITSFHRGHGHLIAKGGHPKLMMAERYGKVTGVVKYPTASWGVSSGAFYEGDNLPEGDK